MSFKLTLSIIVPLYNSHKVFVENAPRLISSIEELDSISDYEILFIDDGSNEKIQHNKFLNSRCQLITNQKNQGLGSVLKTGIELSRYEKVLYLDIDLSYGIKNLKRMIEQSKNNKKTVICSKYLISTHTVPSDRLLYKRLYDVYIEWLDNLDISDIGSGMALFDASTLENIKIKSKGFSVHYEIFKHLKTNKIDIIEIPIEYRYQEGSISLRKHFLQTLIETTKVSNKLSFKF